jgi:hypothetical protein
MAAPRTAMALVPMPRATAMPTLGTPTATSLMRSGQKPLRLSFDLHDFCNW